MSELQIDSKKPFLDFMTEVVENMNKFESTVIPLTIHSPDSNSEISFVISLVAVDGNPVAQPKQKAN